MEKLPIIICVLGPILFVLYLIFRCKEKPKDVFFTSKGTPSVILENTDLSQYQGLRYYRVYLWFYQRKNKNGFTRLVARFYVKCAQLAERFPKVFEYVFLVMCIPQRCGSKNHEWLAGIEPSQRNKAIIEMNILYSLTFIAFILVFGISFSLVRIFWLFIMLIILLGNISTCFKKIDKELGKQP